LAEIANAIEGKYGPISNDARARIIEALRDPGKRFFTDAPEFPGHIHEAVLAENIQAMQNIRTALGEFDPHVVLGQQTGGAFLAQALVSGHPELASRLQILAKPGGKLRVDPVALRGVIEGAASATGSARLAIIDSHMGGGFKRKLGEAMERILPDLPGVQVQSHFIRETLGFSDGGVVLAGRSKLLPGQYKTVDHHVRLVAGDDMHVVTGGVAFSPIQLFGSGGRLGSASTPPLGQTTRSLLISMLGG